jgi:saccharopine dehydrogenase-like NADP-dependent oxidoreductase
MSSRVLVLGAGMIGSAAALDLARTGFDVIIADTHRAALDAVTARAQVEGLQADLADPATVGRLARQADLVVGALPSVLGLQTLRAVIEAGRPCCDISFMPEHAWDLDGLARQHGVTAVVDCGVAPGVSNLLAGWAAARLQPCRTLEIYVGGLPLVRTWPFEYKAGFAPSDVLEEYTRPARLVDGREIVVREALSEPELMDFPGVGTLEAFNTDGLRSLAYLLDVPFMKEKTLRYPGHIALMRVLREMGLFSKDWLLVPGEHGPQRVRPLDVTSALMFPKWRFGPGEADVTVLRVIATGTEEGREVRHVWDLVDRYDTATDTRSMSRTTGYAATSMVTLMAAGAVKGPGVFPPELLARDPGFVERFLEEYAARGVEVEHRVETMG